MFIYSIRSEVTRRYYERRLYRFFDFIQFETNSGLEQRCNNFAVRGKSDINWALNPTDTGGPEHHKWLAELNDLRKLLIIYRLIHFKDPIPDIDIGIIGRDKELAKPLIQLFNETETQAEIITTLQKLLDAKNKRKEARLESVIAPVVIELISKYGYKFQHNIFWSDPKAVYPVSKIKENLTNIILQIMGLYTGIALLISYAILSGWRQNMKVAGMY